MVYFSKKLFLGLLLIVFFTGSFVDLTFAAETDSVQVSASVYCEDNNCEEPITPPPPLRGCTDSEAINYDSNATQDDGSCYYSLPVTNFVAVYDSGDKKIHLSWVNPVFPKYQLTRIIKITQGAPTNDPNGGEIIYEGTGSSTLDPNVFADHTYFYVAFVLGGGNHWSSGVVTSAYVPKVSENEEEDDSNDDENDGGGESGVISSTTDPFIDFPEVVSDDPLVKRLSIFDLLILQPGEPTKTFQDGKSVRIKRDKVVTFFLPYGKVPEVLKTIGITLIGNKYDPKPYSFLLYLNDKRTGYVATINPLVDEVYQLNFYLINFKDQTIKKLAGRLLLSGVAVQKIAWSTLIQKTAAPVVVTTGLAVGFAQILLSMGIGSLFDLYLLLLRALVALLSLFGLYRRRKPWGTVYDAVTKRPIDPAYVTVMKGREKIAEAITDINGRYGFLLSAGTYQLRAQKTHYIFPSQLMNRAVSDEVYNNLYYGEDFFTSGSEVVNKNIPMDPVDFDWNEFVKNKIALCQFYTRKEIIRARILRSIFVLGLVVTIWQMTVQPSYWNLSLLVTYVLIYFFERAWRNRHRAFKMRYDNNEPISFGLLKLFMPGSDILVKTAVADRLGRFFLLVSPGSYYATIDEKQADGSYRRIYQSGIMTLEKGIMNDDLVVSRQI